jgi:thioredoxin
MRASRERVAPHWPRGVHEAVTARCSVTRPKSRSIRHDSRRSTRRQHARDWVPGAAACRAVAAYLAELARERNDLRIVQLNAEEQSHIANHFAVLSAPTLILFRRGEGTRTLVGARPKGEVI